MYSAPYEGDHHVALPSCLPMGRLPRIPHPLGEPSEGINIEGPFLLLGGQRPQLPSVGQGLARGGFQGASAFRGDWTPRCFDVKYFRGKPHVQQCTS